MPDASYDAIVIGGGTNGLIVALYLQDAGMQTAIFDSNMEIGGGLCGDEVPLPGFLTNTCATSVRFYSPPCYEDFDLGEYGIPHIFPKAGQGMIFDDETCLVTYPTYEVVDQRTGRTERSPENVEKTLKEIARFSERDAETASDFLERVEKKWRSAYRNFLFNPPPPPGTKDALEELLDDPQYGIEPRWPLMSAAELAHELWESPEMRTYFSRTIQTNNRGWPGETMGLFALVHMFAVALNVTPPAMVRGGSHSVAHAMQRAFSSMGGKFFVESKVVKILLENSRAKGVCLADGTEVEARKLVVSDTDPDQTLLTFIGEEHFDHKFVQKLKAIDACGGVNILWGSMAVHEIPQYKAAAFNPDCNSMPRTLVGPKDPYYLMEKFKAESIVYGLPSKLYWHSGVDTIWDRTRVPEGKHLIQLEHYTARVNDFPEEKWTEIKREFPKELIKQWQLYAPNMTPENVIGTFIETPVEIKTKLDRNIDYVRDVPGRQGKFRPIPELAYYRTPIEGLYLCSADTHVGVGVRGSCGYTSYKIIAEDFGLKKHWEEKGRSY